MSPPTVLVTGANGLIGSAVAVCALQQGCQVRAVVRRPEAVALLSQHPSTQPFVASGALAVVLMPDMLAPGVLAAAAHGCTAIIHVAAPMKILTDDLGDLGDFGRAATQAIFAAAEQVDSIECVVFTGSVLGLHQWPEMLPSHPINQQRAQGDLTAGDMLTADRMVPDQEPAGPGCAAMHRYLVGKVVTHQQVARYVASHPDARFRVVNILPGYVFGAYPLARTRLEQLTSSILYLVFVVNRFRIGSLYGLSEDEDHPIQGYVCHIDDVAEAHIKALDPALAKGKLSSYLVLSDGPHGATFNDAIAHFQKHLPEAAQQLPFDERRATIPTYFDSSPVEKKLLGRPLKTFDEQVRDTFTHWHALPES